MYIIKEKKGKWILIKKGSKRATKTFSSKAQAVAYAEAKGYKYDIAGTKVDNVIRKASKRKPIVICLIILFLIIIGVALALLLTGVIDSPINLNKAKTEQKDDSGSKNGDSNKNDNNSESGENNQQSGENNSGTNDNNQQSGESNSGSTDNNQQSGENNSGSNGNNQQGENHDHESKIVENVVYNDFQIHFLELGNAAAGDSVYIKAGDKDILIDAGSKQGSAPVLEEYINKYCTDGKLEYVIATHAHEDHIAGMLGQTSSTVTKYKNYKNQAASFKDKDGNTISANGILAYYDIDILIDFGTQTNSTANLTKNYYKAVEYAVSKGTVHYSAYDCFNNVGEAKSTYQLTDDISFDIIYNYFYSNKSSAENNYSVCTLFNYKEHHYLFTGDLEKAGEEKIASYYNKSTPAKTLPHCDLFKGGHHGSDTSSNECLLSLITPDICCVCTCAGTAEYSKDADTQFPSQAFINRIAKYTSRVYITSMIEKVNGAYKLKSMNGTIIVSSDGLDIGLKASNNLTKLKDTTWFNETIYVKRTSSGDMNTASTGTSIDKDIFYNADTEGVISRPRRTWPSYGVR